MGHIPNQQPLDMVSDKVKEKKMYTGKACSLTGRSLEVWTIDCENPLGHCISLESCLKGEIDLPHYYTPKQAIRLAELIRQAVKEQSCQKKS